MCSVPLLEAEFCRTLTYKGIMSAKCSNSHKIASRGCDALGGASNRADNFVVKMIEASGTARTASMLSRKARTYVAGISLSPSGRHSAALLSESFQLILHSAKWDAPCGPSPRL